MDSVSWPLQRDKAKWNVRISCVIEYIWYIIYHDGILDPLHFICWKVLNTLQTSHAQSLALLADNFSWHFRVFLRFGPSWRSHRTKLIGLLISRDIKWSISLVQVGEVNAQSWLVCQYHVILTNNQFAHWHVSMLVRGTIRKWPCFGL